MEESAPSSKKDEEENAIELQTGPSQIIPKTEKSSSLPQYRSQIYEFEPVASSLIQAQRVSLSSRLDRRKNRNFAPIAAFSPNRNFFFYCRRDDQMLHLPVCMNLNNRKPLPTAIFSDLGTIGKDQNFISESSWE